MIRYLFATLAVVLLVPCRGAWAADCSTSTVNHAAEGDCEAAETRRAAARLDAVFRQLLAAADRSAKTTAPVSFTAQIADDQAKWSAWATAECRVIGDMTMGTAAITVEPICLRRLDAERTRQLAELSHGLPQ